METTNQVTQEQIDAWKEKHGSVWRIPLETGEVCYVRSPKIKELEAVQPLLQNGKLMTYNITLFKTCFLGGSDITKIESKLIGASAKMMDTIEVVSSELEKL